MKKSTAKIAFLFGLYIALHFVAACDPGCNCSDLEFPFFDYKALQVKTNNPATDQVLKIEISPDSLLFLAETSPRRGSGFITSAAACDCLGNGDRGDKFPVIFTDVFADHDFNDQFPQDSSLISLFTIGRVYINEPANDIRTVYGPLFEIFNRPIQLATTSRPQDLNQAFVFTIRVIKSNMDTVSIQTDTIRFQ